MDRLYTNKYEVKDCALKSLSDNPDTIQFNQICNCVKL